MFNFEKNILIEALSAQNLIVCLMLFWYKSNNSLLL